MSSQKEERCLRGAKPGFEPWTTGWRVQTDPLDYGSPKLQDYFYISLSLPVDTNAKKYL